MHNILKYNLLCWTDKVGFVYKANSGSQLVNMLLLVWKPREEVNKWIVAFLFV